MVTINAIIEAFLNNPPIYLLLMILTWSYFFPIILLVRNYRQTKSIDYLLMAIMFLFLMVNINIAGIYFNIALPLFYLGTVWFGWLTLFAWYLHAIRVKWKSPPRIYIYSGILIFVFLMLESLFYFFDFELYLSEGTLTNLALIEYFMIEIVRTTVGFFTLFTYMNPRQVIETKRVNNVIMSWRILGASIMIPGIINLISLSLTFILQIQVISGVLFFFDIIAIVSNYCIVILTFYITVRYPEFLFVSEAQILRACKLYVKVRVLEEPRALEQWGLEQIKTYVQSIPASIFEDACPEMEVT